MASPCKQIQEQIAGYVDREIAPSQVSVISRHLQDCPGCAEEATAQQKVKNLVREHAQHVPAPASLRAAIRRRLNQDSPGAGYLAFWQDMLQQRPIPALATTAALLLLLLGVTMYFILPKPWSRPNPATPFVLGSIEGEIICIDCDLLNLTHTPYVHDAAHRIGLRCKDGNIWSILRTEQCHELSKNFRRQVRIVGNLFAGLQYIEVKEFSLI
jgi:mycothiol system anti-sigma-R factor